MKPVIPKAECPECDSLDVRETPEAGYATCMDCGERGYRRGDTVEWWRNDPDSQWYVNDET